MPDEDNLTDYWEVLPTPPPIPKEPVKKGVLWMGLSYGDIELSYDWYTRVAINLEYFPDYLSQNNELIFRGRFDKPHLAPALVNRICLWTTQMGGERGERIYQKDIEMADLMSSVIFTFQLSIKDQPVTSPMAFRRVLQHLGVL